MSFEPSEERSAKGGRRLLRAGFWARVATIRGVGMAWWTVILLGGGGFY